MKTKFLDFGYSEPQPVLFKDKVRMGKMKTLIEGLKGGVRRKLEALPPKARLGIVLTAFALFASLCLCMTVTAITGFGKGHGTMEIRHIEKLDLHEQDGEPI